MKAKLEKFKTKNAKGVLSLLAGNTIAQVIMFIGGIILARIYGPEASGTYNAFFEFCGHSFYFDNISFREYFRDFEIIESD